MPHTGKYTKGEKRELKMKGVIPGTKKAHKVVSKGKAKEILRHGEVKGRTLTKKQKGFFGARAGGLPIISGKYES